MRKLYLLAAVILWSCVKNPAPPSVHLEEDGAIIFPRFSGSAVEVASQLGMPYEVDGATLRALIIAVNDFLPADSRAQPCWNRPESYRYRVIRQENIIFIRIHAAPSSCEGKVLMLDSGVRYAISTEGRILRRLFTGEPDWDSGPAASDGGPGHDTPGERQDASVPELAPVLGAIWEEPRPFSRGGPDGGRNPAPVESQDGGFPAPEGGMLKLRE
jgi:hypothetical protein